MSSVNLTIRCAHQANEDLKIEGAKSDWTVRQLKIYLCDVHPSKPAPERQRIVFAGQLLRDEARLAEYFNRYDNSEPHVLHLVYTASIEDNVAAAERRAKKETELRQRKPLASTNPPAEQRQATVPPAPVAGGSQYPSQYWQWMMPGQQVQFGTTPDAANDWMRQQQQMYAAMNTMMSQWYGQYMQAAYAGGMAGFYPASPNQQPNVFGNVVQQQQQMEPVAQQQEVPRAQAPPQQAINAQGGMAPADMDEDDPRNRDWLDYVYMACRASLLLMILYFYSSIERFVFVLLCCTLMYGLQAGWFGRRGQQQDEQQPQRGPVAGAAQGPLPNRPHDQAAAGGGERAEGAGAEPENEVDRQQAQRQDAAGRRPLSQDIPMTAWNVFWTTCWTFISSFFASLVPERPPPLNM
jgi:hypothetical protein